MNEIKDVPRGPTDLAAVVIKPTLGRVVWYYPTRHDPAHTPGKPHTALIAHVWSDTCVNLAVFDSNGMPYSATSVELSQQEKAGADEVGYATWMPYQKERAVKDMAPIVFYESPGLVQPFGQEVIGGDEGSAQRTGLSAGGLIAAMKGSPAEGDFSETDADNKPPEYPSAA